MKKKCTKCGVEKSIDQFYSIKTRDNIKMSICKECSHKKCKEYNTKNADAIKSKRREYYQEHKEQKKLEDREYYKQNRDKKLEYNKNYYEKNRDRLLGCVKAYSLKHKDRICKQHNAKWHSMMEEDRQEYNRKRREREAANPELKDRRNKKARERLLSDPIWREKEHQRSREKYYRTKATNPELFRQKQNAQRWKREQSDPKFRLRNRFSTAIYNSIKAVKGASWENITGQFKKPYGINELLRHLERHFQPGMSWENYGRGEGKWVIDHIIPVAAFNFDSVKDLDFEKCWALKNLRPMWWRENMEKGAKLTKAFQPSLKLVVG